MYKRILFAFVAVVLLCTSFVGVNVYAEENLTLKLKENLIPLSTTKAENGFEDLMPLKEILKDKKIVGMGEATHGTADFFEMKHRMFEFLVEEMGYRAFGIEAEFGGAQFVNDYILYGKGTIEESLDAMKFWTWHTQEVADMIQWMKEYNDNQDDESKIRFYGFDMQSNDIDKKYILEYLEKVNSPNKAKFNELDLDIEMISKEFLDNKDTFIAGSSAEEYDLTFQHIEILKQCDEYYKKGTDFNFRDLNMAQNVKWILDYESKHYENDKIMLWAHNGHVSKEDGMYKTMGNHLKTMYGEEYYIIGFDFYEGNFVAKPTTFYNKSLGALSKFNISKSPKGSYSDEMQKAEMPISFLDFKNAGKDQVVEDFLSSKVHVNSIGATYFGKLHNVNPMTKIVVKDNFDGMIFVKSTSEAKRTISFIDEITDGDNILTKHYSIIAVILLILGAIIFYISFKIKSKLKKKQFVSQKFYILGKEGEADSNINSFKKHIIKINDHFNSISSFKYLAIALCALSIISIIINKISFIYMPEYSTIDVNSLNLMKIIFNIALEVITMILFTILPLHILRIFSKDKAIKLNHVFIVSIITAILAVASYFKAGILISLIVAILSFVYSSIYCYSYGLFYYKSKRPGDIISILLVAESLITILVFVIISKI